MKRIYLYVLISVTIIASSCGVEDDFLNVLPRGQVIAKTTADFRKLLDYVDNSRYAYSLSLNQTFVDFATDDISMDSTRWNMFSATQEHYKNIFTFKNNIWTYSDQSFTNDGNWNNMYYIISTCNTILIEIEKADDNVELQKQLIAEAKVHIAYAYLQLVNLYAPHYTVESAVATPGIPMYKNAALLPSLKRQSVKEVYDEVIKLLTEAFPDLPDDVNNIYKHRPTKVGTYAVLARTYLYMGDYANALSYADKALALRSYLYDYNTIYTGTVDYYDNLTGISRMTDEEMLLWKTRKGIALTGGTIYTLDSLSFDALYTDFIKDPTDGTYVNNDLRRSLKFNAIREDRKMASNSVSYIFDHYSYRYKTDGNAGGAVVHSAFSTPEMYLIRAECRARTNNLQGALSDVNEICRKRYRTGTFTDLSVSDFQNNAASILERVLLERRRELYGKELRLFDVKRLGIAFSHYLGSMRISVPANDPRLVWSVFPTYVEMNSELEQYDRTQTGVKYYAKNGAEIPFND